MASRAQTDSQERWQRRLLPLMSALLICVTAFFFATSMIQLYTLHGRIERAPTLNLATALDTVPRDAAAGADQAQLSVLRWKTLAVLEGHVLDLRYHQANVLLMSRVWIRYLGFVTGMILAIVGTVFILGKLREETTSASMAAQGASAQITTTSPGLLLAFLGTVLMLATILTHNQIDVRDGPLYTSAALDPAGSRGRPSVDVSSFPPITPAADFQDLIDEAVGTAPTRPAEAGHPDP